MMYLAGKLTSNVLAREAMSLALKSVPTKQPRPATKEEKTAAYLEQESNNERVCQIVRETPKTKGQHSIILQSFKFDQFS